MEQEILPPLPAAIETETDPAIDAGNLPEDLAFAPVEQRSKRWTGITAQKQRMFIAHLAATGAVSMAAKVAGHSTSALYQLRKRDDAASFAAAWDRAVEAGARRVADLLMEYAIYGVPETISKRGQVILERRRPNIRAMQHIAASRFPENFAGIDPVDGRPASAIPHAVRRLREKWQAEWEAERQAAMLEHNARANRQKPTSTIASASSAPAISAGSRTTRSSAPHGTCSPAPAPTGTRHASRTPTSIRKSMSGTCTTPT